MLEEALKKCQALKKYISIYFKHNKKNHNRIMHSVPCMYGHVIGVDSFIHLLILCVVMAYCQM